jgi:hypothetical protein
MNARLATALLAFLLAAAPAQAEKLVVSVSSHRVLITSNFSGDELTLFGTIEPDASGKATVTVPLPAAADGFKRVWVTSEPADGDPKWTTNWIVRAA